MDSIFVRSSQAEFWLSETSLSYTIVPDIDAWHQCTGRRIAMIEVLDFDPDTHDMLARCCDQADLLLIFIPEFIDDAWCRTFDHDNVVFFLNGRLNWDLKAARALDLMYFFWSTCDFYRSFPALLDQLDGPKDLVFDVLLGRRKPHRDRLWQAIDHAQNVVTYFPQHQDQDIRTYGVQQFQWPEDVLPLPDDAVNFTVQEVKVDGVIVSLSQIIPRDIYRRTRYSLVAETMTQNSFSFFTEKIVKPILARRLFLVAAGQYYLRNLQDFGFQTFGCVVDESYDAEPDADKRLEMMLDQAARLHNTDYDLLLPKIQAILDHNYRLMTDTDWQGGMIKMLQQVIDQTSVLCLRDDR